LHLSAEWLKVKKSRRFTFGCRPLDPSAIIDALSASFFGLLGIWAAVDRRHWFIRFGLVCGILLFLLFIPAYEIVVIFGVAMTLIATGVWIARGRRRWRPRLSLETALLAMVVVAIVAAVASHLPEIRWIPLVHIACRTAIVALACLRIVSLNRPPWPRLMLGLSCIALLLVGLHFMHALQLGLSAAASESSVWKTLARHYAPKSLPSWVQSNLPTIGLGMALMLSALTLANASGWFTSAKLQKVQEPRLRVTLARGAFSFVLLTVAVPLLYVFYRLLTPPTLPVVTTPAPNGYHDFIAAGALTPSIAPALRAPAGPPTRAVLEAYYRDSQSAADRIAIGLRKECWTPKLAPDQCGISDRDFEALTRAAGALRVRVYYLGKHGPIDALVEASFQCLRFGHEATRGAGFVANLSEECEDVAVAALNARLGELDSAACRSIAHELSQIASRREPLEIKRTRERIIEQNRGWSLNLGVVISEWSTEDRYQYEETWPRWINANTQLLIVNLAAQAFTLDHRRPPNSLEQLVPDYLSVVPIDEFGDEPLKYRRVGPRYTIYSLGPDEDNDDGRMNPPSPRSNDFDMVVQGPNKPPLWMRLQDATVEGFKSLWQAGTDAAKPTAE
jgi:hypothetical protein